jgi:hypothetical protein
LLFAETVPLPIVPSYRVGKPWIIPPGEEEILSRGNPLRRSVINLKKPHVIDTGTRAINGVATQLKLPGSEHRHEHWQLLAPWRHVRKEREEKLGRIGVERVTVQRIVASREQLPQFSGQTSLKRAHKVDDSVRGLERHLLEGLTSQENRGPRSPS